MNSEASPRGKRILSVPGLDIIALGQGLSTEYHLNAFPGAGEDFSALCRNLAAAVQKYDARILSMEIFGVAAGERAVVREAFGEISWPITWLTEGADSPNPLYGIQASAITHAEVTPIYLGDNLVGSVFDLADARCCRIGGLAAPDITASRADQTKVIFEQMIAALEKAGMGFSDVVRTWFYNYQMLEWYDIFNAVRTTFFKEHGVFDGLVPASTGIGGANRAGAALTGGLLAVRPAPGIPPAMIVPSPLQCPAPAYGSSFSRAAEWVGAGFRRLIISGTASIEPGGASVHQGDTAAQIALTMEVIAAILHARRMDWADVTRAIAYFKYAGDAPLLREYRQAHRIPEFPVLYTCNDICRDDLLFEMELDAVVPQE